MILDLVEDVRGGENKREAQEQLYLLLEAKLLAALKSRIPESIRGRIDAEDVLHEALLRAFKGLDSVQLATEKAFVAWVYRIARNLLLDQVKRRSAAAVAFAVESGGPVPRESRVPGRERGVESRLQRSDWIESALARLKKREAEVIRLHLLGERSFEEIGEAWGKKAATIKRLYSLALKNLRELAAGEEANGG